MDMSPTLMTTKAAMTTPLCLTLGFLNNKTGINTPTPLRVGERAKGTAESHIKHFLQNQRTNSQGLIRSSTNFIM